MSFFIGWSKKLIQMIEILQKNGKYGEIFEFQKKRGQKSMQKLQISIKQISNGKLNFKWY
jgi:hypothetical protein